jgi:alpha-tubulin suppressor-like RCC1 family protein
MPIRLPASHLSALVFAALLLTPSLAAAADPAIAFGSKHAVALRNNGDVLTWGDNLFCQLGRPSSRNSAARPEVVLRNAREIAVSGNHTLAVTVDGKVYAWGANEGGALGTGSANDSCEGPQLVESLGAHRIAHVATGNDFSVAVSESGDLFCAGGNGMGQCPPAGRDKSLTFVPLTFPGLAGTVEAVRAGAFHALARTRDGRLFAFGRGRDGQLGTGAVVNGAGFVTGLTDVVAFGAGIWHSVAVRADGTAWAWGNDSKSQLCDGATVNRSTPARIDVPGAPRIAGLAVGAHGTMLRAEDGTLFVCGDNQFASLGVKTAPIVPRPAAVPGLVLQKPVLASGGWYGAVSADGCSVRIAGQSDAGLTGHEATLWAFTPRQDLSLCAPAGAAQPDLVRTYPKGGVSGCWTPRVEEDAAASPRFAPLYRGMLAVEDLLKANAAFMAAPEPSRYRTSFAAGPSDASGARIHVKVVPERKGDGTRLWTAGCGVIPQVDRIGGPIAQVSIFFNPDVRGQFIGPSGEPPALKGRIGGFPVYDHWVVITKDGRLPWVPLTLGEKLDAEIAARAAALDAWTRERAGDKAPDVAAAERAAVTLRKTDPAGADNFVATVKATLAEFERYHRDVVPARTAALEKQLADAKAYRAAFSPEQLRMAAVWADASGEQRRRLDARIAELQALTPDEQRQIADLNRQGRATDARAVRTLHMERASPLMDEARAQYQLSNLRPGPADHAMAVKPDPALPDMKDPNRIQLITVMIAIPPHAKQADWQQRVTDAFDFAALAALLK